MTIGQPGSGTCTCSDPGGPCSLEMAQNVKITHPSDERIGPLDPPWYAGKTAIVAHCNRSQKSRARASPGCKAWPIDPQGMSSKRQ